LLRCLRHFSEVPEGGDYVCPALLVAGADFLESFLVLPVALMRLLGLSKLTQLTKGKEHACASVVRD